MDNSKPIPAEILANIQEWLKSQGVAEDETILSVAQYVYNLAQVYVDDLKNIYEETKVATDEAIAVLKSEIDGKAGLILQLETTLGEATEKITALENVAPASEEEAKPCNFSVNGRVHESKSAKVSYDDITALAFGTSGSGKVYSITYAGPTKEGILKKGGVMIVEDQMMFHVAHTGQA